MTLQTIIKIKVIAVLDRWYLANPRHLVNSVPLLTVAAIFIIVETLCTVSMLAGFACLCACWGVVVHIHALIALEAGWLLHTYLTVLYCTCLGFLTRRMDLLAYTAVFCRVTWNVGITLNPPLLTPFVLYYPVFLCIPYQQNSKIHFEVWNMAS